MKKKFTFLMAAICVLLLTLFAQSYKLMGATESYGWESSTSTGWTTYGITRANSNAHTGSYSGSIATTDSYIQFNTKVKVTSFSFYFKRTSTNSKGNVYIETSEDGSDWSAVETYSTGYFNNGSYTQGSHTFTGNTTAYYVRVRCEQAW